MISSQPMRARLGGLFLARNRADHAQAEQLGELHRQQPDPARRRVKQDRVAGLEPGVGLEQPVGRRKPAHRRSGCVFERDRVGQLEQRRGRHHALGAIGPERTAVVG